MFLPPRNWSCVDPGTITSFLEDFEGLDVRHQKAQLQAILKSAYVVRDDRIELEFRG